MQTKGLTERRGLAVVGMSASSLRYEPRPDRNVALRARIVALAQRYRRYGVGMIHLKLRQAGEFVNYKRVERLYRLEARITQAPEEAHGGCDQRIRHREISVCVRADASTAPRRAAVHGSGARRWATAADGAPVQV